MVLCDGLMGPASSMEDIILTPIPVMHRMKRLDPGMQDLGCLKFVTKVRSTVGSSESLIPTSGIVLAAQRSVLDGLMRCLHACGYQW